MASVTEERSTGAAQTSQGIDVLNPATGEVVATVADFSPEEVARTVARARAAQPAWEALGFAGRERVFKRAQRWVIDHTDEIVETLAAEAGKPYEDALVHEVSYAADILGFWAKMAPKYLADEKIRSHSPFVLGAKLVIRHVPVGVVGVIGPWNFPLNNSFGDCVPALAAGNTVVLKPSEVTPLTSLLMERMMRECGAAEGVFSVVTGYGATGAALVDEVDYVMFTGSTETGKKIMAKAAETLTPVSLELGGKDPMIVLADADLERAANAAVYYSFDNAGQVCLSTERVYVEAPVYDEFVGKVTEKVSTLRQGPPGEMGSVDVGPLIFDGQLDIVERHVEDAKRKGAKVLAGGRRRPGPGNFYEPTVLVDVDHSMDAMRQETFGPTMPIMKVSDAEEAVRLANDSEFGLSASVWTKDVRKGEALARRMEAGVVSVNDSQLHYAATELPMGGWKHSGLGHRHGAGGILKYTRPQSIMVTRFGPKKAPHMFPYRRTVTNLMLRGLRAMYGRRRTD
jgi:acyl-CoA reductase-like NAD-dependent aldehyde dehydrogenase